MLVVIEALSGKEIATAECTKTLGPAFSAAAASLNCFSSQLRLFQGTSEVKPSTNVSAMKEPKSDRLVLFFMRRPLLTGVVSTRLSSVTSVYFHNHRRQIRVVESFGGTVASIDFDRDEPWCPPWTVMDEQPPINARGSLSGVACSVLRCNAEMHARVGKTSVSLCRRCLGASFVLFPHLQSPDGDVRTALVFFIQGKHVHEHAVEFRKVEHGIVVNMYLRGLTRFNTEPERLFIEPRGTYGVASFGTQVAAFSICPLQPHVDADATEEHLVPWDAARGIQSGGKKTVC